MDDRKAARGALSRPFGQESGPPFAPLSPVPKGESGRTELPEQRLIPPEPADGRPGAPELADAQAIRRIRAGDSGAFQAIIERYQARVFRLVYQSVGGRSDAIEDCVQEIFLRVFRGIASFQGDAGLGTWIHRIAVNYLIGAARRARALKRNVPTYSLEAPLRSHQGEFVPELGDRREEPARAVQNKERGSIIRHEIEALDRDLRRVILLREVEQMSYEEIAEVVDIPIGTVRSRLHRARGILQERLRHLL